jgi:hypothetical protein
MFTVSVGFATLNQADHERQQTSGVRMISKGMVAVAPEKICMVGCFDT